MAYGDSPDDAELRAAWHEFCEQLRAAGEEAFKDSNPPTPLLRADAFRHRTQNLGQAFDLALETRDGRFPILHQFVTPLRKLGGDAADFSYQQAWIDGECTYRISGTKGSARFFNLTVHGERPAIEPATGAPSIHEPFGDLPEVNMFGEQIAAANDGTVELFIGGTERAGNWLPTTASSRKIFIRQGFDRWDETPWQLRIERVGIDTPRPLPTPATMVESMDWAGRFLHDLMEQWPDHRYRHSGGWIDPERVNEFPGLESPDADDAKRGRAVAMMIWALAPDDALVLELDATDDFWMASLGGVFMNSFDYLYRAVSFTTSRAAVDRDAKVRLVMCASDPGYRNWLDTQAFEQGILAFRTVMGAPMPTLHTQVVPRAELASALPADSARVTRDERRAELLERFHAIQHQRFGL